MPSLTTYIQRFTTLYTVDDIADEMKIVCLACSVLDINVLARNLHGNVHVNASWIIKIYV